MRSTFFGHVQVQWPGSGPGTNCKPAKFEVMEDMEDDSFEGTQFVENDLRTGDVYAVTYKKETLQQLTTAIQNTAAEHGFGPVDPTTLLKSIHGVGDNVVVSIPGPTFTLLKAYPIAYNFCEEFLSRDRKFVRSLLEIVLCKPSFLPHSWEAVSLEEVVVSVEFDHSTGKRKIELFYFTELSKADRIGVTIEGCGAEPNSFQFRHSIYWLNKRLLAPFKGRRSERYSHLIEEDLD